MNEAHLLDLHHSLRSDVSGARRADLLARLQRLRDGCEAAKRQPSDRDAYRRLQAAGVALTASIRIVESMPIPGAERN